MKVLLGFRAKCDWEKLIHWVSRKVAKVNQINRIQKQPFSDVLLKRCSENMQQIYKRKPMPKYDFSKAAKQLY